MERVCGGRNRERRPSESARRIPGIALTLLAALGACRAGSEAVGPAFSGAPDGSGRTWFTQFALFHERDRFRTTNYRRGLLLPINSEVTLLSMDSKRITVRVASSGQKLTIENVRKHTGDTTEQAFGKILGATPLDLSGFTDAERAAIRSGRVEVGMSRDAVLAAMGHPPATGTPTLESKSWKYWSTRMTTFVVRFGDDGRVAEVGRRRFGP